MADDQHPQDQASRGSAEPDLATSVAGVVDAALGVGVSLARVVAQATAPGATVSVPAGTPPVQAIVRYGVTAVGNVAQAVMAGARSVRNPASAFTSAFGGAKDAAAKASSAASAAPHGPGLPRAAAGSVLRVPLSVENPSDHAMQGLSPRLRGARTEGGADIMLPAGAVAFFPPNFDVAPHDFEKLVVQIAVPAALPPGRCDLVLALGDDEPDLTMSFVVTPTGV